jgi:ribonucleoside-diphosphate reductase beta chain
MIFDEQIKRKPDYYPWAQEYIDAMHESFWTDKEFSFQSDLHDFKTSLTKSEQEMVVKSLAAIGQLEISVKKFWSKIGDNLPHPSINDMGYVMANIEVIHGNAYERLLEVLGLDAAFDELMNEDIIRRRVNYLRKHLHKFHQDNKKQFVYSLILFTLFVENIALFSQFYIISWFGRYKNTLKDTCKQVEYTSREENIHAEIGIRLINTIREEYPELFDEELENKIISEARDAVNYECEIVNWIVNGYEADKLNSNLLKEFIKNRMNESLVKIGYSKIFEVDQAEIDKTDWFDEQVLGNNMSDFFVSRPSEYAKSNQSFDESELF